MSDLKESDSGSCIITQQEMMDVRGEPSALLLLKSRGAPIEGVVYPKFKSGFIITREEGLFEHEVTFKWKKEC